MGRASIIATNFTGGELSPAISLGRVDIAKYNNGVRRLENCVLTVQGGAKRRPGSRFIARTKLQASKARLIDFVYNRGQAYILELGAGYARFLKDRQLLSVSDVPVEVSTPYTEAQIPSVNYVQKSDTAFFVHEQTYPHRLQRFSNVQWGMGPVTFINEPFEEQGHFPVAGLTLSALTGAATINSDLAAFLASDVGRHITSGGGDALITAVNSDIQVAVQILSPFPSLSVAAGSWNLTGSPQTTITPSAQGAIGDTITLSSQTSALEAAKNIEAFTKVTTDTVDLDVTAHGYATGDVVVLTETGASDGMDRDGSYVATVIDLDTIRIPDAGRAFTGLVIVGAIGKVQRSTGTGGVPVWRAADVGSMVQINGGLVRILTVPSPQLATATVIRPLTSAVSVGANGWTLETAAWNVPNGYPRAVTINKQRLMFAGSPGYPQTVWASEIQGYLNFSFGTDDDDAFRFELDGPRNSPIRHLAPARQLLVLTESDEMSLKGGQEKPITPTNIQKTDESTAGASSVRPIKIGGEMLFVQAAGKKVNAIGYRYEIDGFASPDRTIFSSHITGARVEQIAHQKEPDSTLYAVRSDGQMAVCAYDIDQEVTGWGRWITQGSYESIATIPTTDGEDAYAIVRRESEDGMQRYIEVFDPEMLVDCGISGTNPMGQATWSGLGHLEGKVVQAWGDGEHLGAYTVLGGAVTLSQAVKSVQIGLGFTCLIEMLQIEVGGNGTTAQGSQIHVNEVILRVLDTQAAVLNGKPIEFRALGPDLLDRPTPTFTGDLRGTTLSDSSFKTQQIITQPYPLPFHLLDVIRRVTINE